MICFDPPCTKACPQHADVGNILRSLYFRNYIGAVNKLSCDCTYCNAPCEKACVLSGRNLPVDIREVLVQVKKNAGVLPVKRIEQVDLSADICGIKLENPFLLSSVQTCMLGKGDPYRKKSSKEVATGFKKKSL